MPKGKKGFQLGHKEGFTTNLGGRKVSKQNVCVRPFEDQVSRIKAVPDLQKRLRAFFDDLISGQSGSSG